MLLHSAEIPIPFGRVSWRFYWSWASQYSQVWVSRRSWFNLYKVIARISSIFAFLVCQSEKIGVIEWSIWGWIYEKDEERERLEIDPPLANHRPPLDIDPPRLGIDPPQIESSIVYFELYGHHPCVPWPLSKHFIDPSLLFYKWPAQRIFWLFLRQLFRTRTL